MCGMGSSNFFCHELAQNHKYNQVLISKHAINREKKDIFPQKLQTGTHEQRRAMKKKDMFRDEKIERGMYLR